jgi:hypothetical protein
MAQRNSRDVTSRQYEWLPGDLCTVGIAHYGFEL